MSKIHRSTGLTRFLARNRGRACPGRVVVRLFRLPGPGLRWRQDPGGLEMPNLGPFPGDFDIMPRRGTRAKTAKKKGLLAERRLQKGRATGKAKTADAKKTSATRAKSSFHKISRRSSWPIASVATVETKPGCKRASSI